VKPSRFRYSDPVTVDEAIDLLASHENAKVLAGGQSLMPMLNMRYVQPDHLIDLNRISELSGFREQDGILHIGAMTRQRELEFSALIHDRCSLMHEALRNVGHRQTRNRGTIGGSLCHLDPAAELVSVATAYDAVIEARGPNGAREIPMAEFPLFYMTPSIAPDEIVTGVRFALWPRGHASAFLEFARRRGDFAIVSVAVLLDISEHQVRRASVTVSGLTHLPERIADAEMLLCRGPISTAVIRDAAAACGSIETMSDVHASASYRQHLARTLVSRCLTIALARGGVPRSVLHG